MTGVLRQVAPIAGSPAVEPAAQLALRYRATAAQAWLVSETGAALSSHRSAP
jgi:hypothetical protein